MLSKNKLFIIMYVGSLGIAAQPVKASTKKEAKDKFLVKNKKIKRGSIIDCDEMKSDHKHYAHMKNHSI